MTRSTRWKYKVTRDRDGWTIAIWKPTPLGLGHERYVDVLRGISRRYLADREVKELRYFNEPAVHAAQLIRHGAKPYRIRQRQETTSVRTIR